MPTPAKKTDEAQLEDYLKSLGLKNQIKVIKAYGIDSLEFLKAVCANSAERKGLAQQIRGDNPDGPARIAAGIVEKLTAKQVQTRIDQLASETEESGSANFDQKKQQLADAIEAVEKLRKETADAAAADREAATKQAQAQLDRILAKVNAKELLKGGETSFATIAGATALMERIQEGLQSKIADSLNGYLDQRPRSTAELLEENQLLRGYCASAAGLARASGSNLLDMAALLGKPAPIQTQDFEFSSEAAYSEASQQFETSASSYATANSARGAMFMGTGIGAASLMVQYATAGQRQRDEAAMKRSQKATKLRVHYQWAPQATLTLPSNRFALSEDALDALRAIEAAPPAQKAAAAAEFLRSFGSHVFCTAVLGGWYKHVAKASCSSSEQMRTLDEALSTATNWAVSASASYVGLSGAGSVSSAHAGGVSAARATSTAMSCVVKEQQVSVATSVFGGLPELPSDLWLTSVKANAHWQVIDRSDEQPVWKIVGLLSAKTLGFDRKAMAELLERAWVNEVFIPSIADAKVREAMRPKALASAAALTEALLALTRPPAMRLTVIQRRWDQAEQHFGKEVALPKGYKILAGGVSAVTQAAGNFVVASYPKVSGQGADQRWSWCARMKDIKHVSKVRHALTIVALHDPDDVWDVQVFVKEATAHQTLHEIALQPPGDFLLTGCGGEVDVFSMAALKACGFAQLDGKPPAASERRCQVVVRTTDLVLACPHTAKAYAIGVRARAGTALDADYQYHRFGATSNHDHTVTHALHPGGDESKRSVMIAGGACLTDADMHHGLTGSRPVVSDAWRGGAAQVYGWLATSKDHEIKQTSAMTLYTLGLSNVDIVWEAEPAGG